MSIVVYRSPELVRALDLYDEWKNEGKPPYRCPSHGWRLYATCDVCCAQCEDWRRDA